MNERIRELTVKALSSCNPAKMTSLSSSVDNGDGVDIPLEFSAKFAELIVQECATLMAEQKKYYADPGKYETMEYYARMEAKEDAFSDAEEIIKKHFGVE